MADRKTIHLKLLTDISDHMDPSSAECENFVKHITTYVPKGILSRNKTILNKLQCLETKGHLSPGQYGNLRKIAIDSGNTDLTELIDKAETDIRNVEERSEGIAFNSFLRLSHTCMSNQIKSTTGIYSA